MRHAIHLLAAFVLIATACSGNQGATAASGSTPAASGAGGPSATTSTTVGGVTLQTSTMAIADVNEAVATRYGIDRAQDGMLLLVTVRDAAGDGIDPGDLKLTATAGALPDAPTSLPLRAIVNGDMTDYIGVMQAKAPASVQFKLVATRGGSRADIATTAELLPR